MTAEPRLVDSHAHLDTTEFAVDRDDVLRRAAAAGVAAIITVGVDLASSRAAVALAEKYPQVVAAVGLHPHHAAICDRTILAELRRLASHKRVVAIGEIGLDFCRGRTPRDLQQSAFRAQLRLATDLGLPIIVHDREAHDQVLATIAAEVGSGRDRLGVLHCFSADTDIAHVAGDLGLLLSIAGPVTYPNSRHLDAVVRDSPAERLLAETDSPFLPPQSSRGQRNEPANVRFILEKIAALRGESLVNVAKQTTANAERLFGPRLMGQPPWDGGLEDNA